MKIAAVIVAAGRASRFQDGHKLLASLHGVPIIRLTCEAIAAAPFADIVLVIAPDGAAIAEAAGPGRWRTVINEDAALGLSTSIRAGIAALDARSDGALIALGDMPLVGTALIERLCQVFADRKGEKIAFPQLSDGRQANPVIWPRWLFADLMRIEGDVGGKALLGRHVDLQAPVAIDEHDAAALDIDTVADLERAHALSLKR